MNPATAEVQAHAGLPTVVTPEEGEQPAAAAAAAPNPEASGSSGTGGNAGEAAAGTAKKSSGTSMKPAVDTAIFVGRASKASGKSITRWSSISRDTDGWMEG